MNVLELLEEELRIGDHVLRVMDILILKVLVDLLQVVLRNEILIRNQLFLSVPSRFSFAIPFLINLSGLAHAAIIHAGINMRVDQSIEVQGHLLEPLPAPDFQK